MAKICPICKEPLDWKGRCSSEPCPVYRVKGRGTRRGGVPGKIVFCSRPRLRPLTDLEVEALAYGNSHEVRRGEAAERSNCTQASASPLARARLSP